MPATESSHRSHSLSGVTAGAAMHPGVFVVQPDTPLRKVAQIMAVQAVHAVLVPTEGPRGLGWPSAVVSDLDLVRAAVDADVGSVTAADAASEHSSLVDIHDPLDSVARHMAGSDTDHFLVADRWSALPDGIISAFDIIAVLGGRDPRLARLVRPRPARPAISERRLDHVRVRDAMHAGVVACAPDADVPSVAAALADHRIHALAVGDTARRGTAGEQIVCRMLDAMDVVRAAAARQPDVTAIQLAATERLTIDETEDMRRAAQLMAEHSLSHLVVVDRLTGPVGVVSTLDVASICGIS